ncbi:MAG: hypothetical protein GXY55_19855 [Phycisphaerae bacterium]|nr:hypothetical protein [Phycisphaerae bacterium]
MVTKKQGGRVEFRFCRPNARRVFLAGDFNGWNPSVTPMTRTASGEWVHELELGEGVYQFKYLADDAWFLDYAAFGIEQGPFGWNSVIVVDKQKWCQDGMVLPCGEGS